MSLRGAKVVSKLTKLAEILLLTIAAALPAFAQYPGQVTKTGKEAPELRSIAVLEWTGDAGKPKTSRLVPVAVLDGGKLQDGGIYLARPQPLALSGEVEYELQQDGKPIGLFDIKNAGQEQGSWVGYGSWKPIPAVRPRPSAQVLARTRIDDDAQSDQPVLHRKHHAGEQPASGAGSAGNSGSDSDSGEQAPTADPDRPTLHKKTSSDSAADTAANSPTSAGSTSPAPADTGSSQASDADRPSLHKRTSSDSTADASSGTTPTGTSSSQATDPDRPTLHKRTSAGSSGSGSGTASAQSDDPDRPTLKKKKQADELGNVDAVPDAEDPDRPRLKRGKSSGGGTLDVVPTLMGIPPEMRQAVAVSDARNRPAHPWNYSWSNPEDEAKMKSALEDIARGALGLNPPPPKTAPKRTSTSAAAQKAARKSAQPAPPPPAELFDEQFRVFELAYGAGATIVLTAHTGGPFAQQKFVTLIAQPDLYGNVLVLFKNVADGAHLDETPRMRLVDAVDAMADNRGELLFELRGATQRQFALYRVLRGQAEKLFTSGGGDFGVESRK